ncbi:MAG: glycoside hydrolase family 76 protein [Oscillospiraceae bacterium]|nr:glycoside hydrolase family 76 protein [Oscillospiraceae bacterium]
MINIFAYCVKILRGVLILIISVTCTGLLKPAGVDYTFAIEDKAERYERRARILTGSTEKNFFDKSTPMLHNNSRFQFTAAGCWDTTALLTIYTKLAEIDSAYIKDADRAIQALGHYGRQGSDCSAYTGEWSMFQNNSRGQVYYDDNMWVGRDLVALYNLTDDEKYLERAIVIADMIIAEGWVDLDQEMFTTRFGRAPGGELGGFYWRDDHVALHVCSNGPAIQFLAQLSQVANNGKGDEYLDYAVKSYRFLQYLERDIGVFWDLMTFHKDADNNIIGINVREGSSFSYNSGTPISSAIELYKLTGDEAYLEDAIRWSSSADAFFAKDSDVDGVKSFTDLPWFREILLMGYIDLYEFDEDALGYIQNMEDSINYGYENHRLNGVLGFNQNVIPRNWVSGFEDKDEMRNAAALEQIPCAGIYASLALFYASIG